LYKYGYDGPVYCSEPTASLMTLLQLDNLDVLSREGLPSPYDQKDVREAVIHSIPLKYGVVTDIAPDIRLTLQNAGHILGSSIIHLHIGEGIHNIVYTGDFKFGHTMLLESANTKFPRVETLIVESTYGASEDVMPQRRMAEGSLVSVINETVEKGGKILIPVPAVGRSQEIMLVLNRYMTQGLLKEVPVYIEGMIREATAIHTAYPEYLDKKARDQILYQGENPFQSDYFTIVEHPENRAGVIEGEPCVILATSGMLEGGPSVDYFKNLASDERNSLVFVSYQIDGTLGSKVRRGRPEVQMLDTDGKMKVFRVGLRVESVDGFSGHSDRKQIISYVGKVYPRPERVIVNHGEKTKCLEVAGALHKIYKVDTCAPRNLETIRLK
ncbi:MAG: beta-CASP ribonuclease aCPSF1, partial [Candidatus Bathyarchaeota archaeon]|nr:beta-CASP ribonuclease aCPSF1 [Candidatus Bathyarchaeota archaeon]